MTTNEKTCTCVPLLTFANTEALTACAYTPEHGAARPMGVPVLMTGPEVAAVLGVSRQAVAYHIKTGNYTPDYVTASGITLFRAARVSSSGVLPR